MHVQTLQMNKRLWTGQVLCVLDNSAEALELTLFGHVTVRLA
jgi:hypothetical protein